MPSSQPDREQKTESELREWIINQVRTTSVCRDFDADFHIMGVGTEHVGKHMTREPVTWNFFSFHWKSEDQRKECYEEFQKAVGEAQRRFDLKP